MDRKKGLLGNQKLSRLSLAVGSWVMQREARWQKNLQSLYDSQQGGVFELM